MHMLSFLRAFLLALLPVLALAACDDSESAANKTFVSAAERITAAGRATSPTERYKLLREADILIAGILKEHGGTAAAVRISANEKVGTLTRQELASALQEASAHPDVCLNTPTKDCVKAMLQGYVRAAPTHVADISASIRDSATRDAVQNALLAIGVLDALSEPVDTLLARMSPQLAKKYREGAIYAMVNRPCALAISVAAVHGMERAKAYLKRTVDPKSPDHPCIDREIGATAYQRLGKDALPIVLEIVHTVAPNASPETITSALIPLTQSDCESWPAVINKLVPFWSKTRLSLLASLHSECKRPIQVFDTLYGLAQSATDKEQIAGTARHVADASLLERYAYVLKSPDRNRWSEHYSWLKLSVGRSDTALLKAVIPHISASSEPTTDPNNASTIELRRTLAAALVAGNVDQIFAPLSSQYTTAPKAPTDRALHSHCHELLSIAQTIPRLTSRALMETCLGAALRAYEAKSSPLKASASENMRSIFTLSAAQGSSAMKALLARLPDGTLPMLLSEVSGTYDILKTAGFEAEIDKALPRVTGREKLRIRSFQLVDELKTGNGAWRAELRRDPDLRQWFIEALFLPSIFGDGPWRTTALDMAKEDYPGMVNSFASRSVEVRIPLQERLLLVRRAMATDNKPWLPEAEQTILFELAWQYIRENDARSLLQLVREPALKQDMQVQVWIIGEAAILMSAE
jgi:hypothetical protein